MIELDLTPTALIQRSGGFVTAGASGQEVQLSPSAEWQGLRLNLRFSDGWHVRDVTASGGSAEIPLDVISTPWRSLSMSVAGFDADGRRVAGPVRCRLGYTMPEGAQASGGGGSGGADLSNYYTRAQVDSRLAAKLDASEKPDTSAFITSAALAPYALKSEIPAAPDLSGYAKTTDIPDTSGFALKSEIPAAPDLSGYAKTTDIPDTSGFALKSEIPAAPDLSGYAKTTDIPDTSGFALKSEIPAAPDLSAYATTAAMNTALAGKADATALTGLVTMAQVQAYIAGLDGTNMQV